MKRTRKWLSRFLILILVFSCFTVSPISQTSVYAAGTLKITQQPKDVVVPDGADAVFTVVAEGEGLTYTWYYKNPNMSSFSKSTNTTNTFSTTMTAARDGRQSYCIVKDKNGNSVQSNTVTMTLGTPQKELKITKQPVDATAAVGENAVFTIEAEGDGLTYTWYYKNADKTTFTKSTVTKATYTTAMTADRDGRQIYCIVKDSYGNSVQSKTVTMKLPALNTLKITKQPVDTSAAVGQNAVLTIEAEGEGLTYAWYYKNADKTTFSKSTVTKPTYTTSMSADRDGRQVYCIVTDSKGNTVQSNTVTLSLPVAKLKITKQPVDTSAAAGEYAILTIEAEGEGLTYAWYYKNADKTTFSKSTVTKASYTTSMSADRDGRQVYCIVKDSKGNTVQSNTVTLSLPAVTLKITKQPVNAIAAVGENAVFTVEAEGDGLTYTWYYKNADKTTFTKSTATKATYTTAMTADRNGRQVYCIVTDSKGNTIQTNTVTMKLPVSEIKITKQPVDATVAEGENAVFTVEAEGDGLTYAWYYKNVGKTAFTKSTVTKASYSTTVTADRDGRQVYCIVTDAYGNSVQTNTVTMRVQVRKELKITQQPKDITIPEGYDVVFTVEAEGDGLTYVWYYKNPDKTTFSKSTNTTDTYTLAMTAARSGREMYCVITDKYGNSLTSRTATMTMLTPAVITIINQPVKTLTATPGQIYSISVDALISGGAGTETLTYQWQQKSADGTWTDIAGATNAILTLEANNTNVNMMYRCVVGATGYNVTSVTSENTAFIIASEWETEIL